MPLATSVMAAPRSNRTSMYMRAAVILGFLAVFLEAACLAQQYPVQLVPGSPKDIVKLMQDSLSRVWAATKDDLFMFDGVRFYSLHPYGFPQEGPTTLAEDSSGGIWAGTPDGLYRFAKGRVQRVLAGYADSVVSIAPGVMLASFTPEKIRTSTGDVLQNFFGLYRITNTGGEWKAEAMLSADGGQMLAADHSGNALYLCRGGWCELNRSAILSWRTGAPPPMPERHMLNVAPGRIQRDRFGCLWMRGGNYLVYQCPGESKWSGVAESAETIDGAQQLSEFPDGSILMENPVAVGRPGKFQTASSENGVPSPSAVLAGKDGTIWLADSAGLHKWIYPFRTEYWTARDGLSSPYTLLRLGNKVYVGGANGIHVLSGNRKQWDVLAPATQTRIVLDLLAGPGGNTMYAATSHGLELIGTDGKTLAYTGEVDGGIRVLQDARGQLWLTGRWVERISRQGSKLVRTRETVPGNAFLDMENGPDGSLWICASNGLHIYDGQTWRHLGPKQGLAPDGSLSLAVQSNGQAWLSYYNLRKFSLIKNAMSDSASAWTFTNGEHVGDAHSTSLDFDRRGWIWRGSDNAIYLATAQDAESGEWLRIDEEDGFPQPGINQQTVLDDADGSMWFGNGDTITHFYPGNDFATRLPVPSAFLSGISLTDGSTQIASGSWTIPNGSTAVAHVGSLLFDRRNEMHLRYRILPQDKNWNAVMGFDIPLRKLYPGSHMLELQGQVGSGPWLNLDSASLSVAWPWWLRWPAILSAFAALALTGIGLAYRRAARRKLLSIPLPDLSQWRTDAQSPEVIDLLGTTLNGRYRLDGTIASGGFGTVILGLDVETGNPCAVKVLHRSVGQQEWVRGRFEQEVKVLEQVSHPNVVKIYGHGTTPTGDLFLAMEFIDGGSLRDALAKAPLPPQTAAIYLHQVTRALASLHERQIYHRDIKPENIMLRASAPVDGHVVLIDFSIAIVQEPDQTIHGISRVEGTLQYMAPEQLYSAATAATDIYSTAKVLLEMLSGSRLSDLLPRAKMDLPFRVRQYLEQSGIGLTAEALSQIEAALEFDPSRRPQDVGQFAAPIIRDLSAFSVNSAFRGTDASHSRQADV